MSKYIATERLLKRSRCGYLVCGTDTLGAADFTLRSGGRSNSDVFKFNVEVKCQRCELNAFFGGYKTYVGGELVKVVPRSGRPLDQILFWVKSDGKDWVVTPPKELEKSCEHIKAVFAQYAVAS